MYLRKERCPLNLQEVLNELENALILINRVNLRSPEWYTNVKPIVRQIAKVKAAIRKEESS